MNTNDQRPILLIGGNGKTGSRVAALLEARGVAVRIGSRAGNPSFEWQDSSGWAKALDGVRAAYITYYPDIALPGALEAIRAFIKVALDNGVSRLVLLSGRGEEEAQRAEQALIGSGADWTIVRAAWFMQNFSESFFLDEILAGEVVFPRDGMPEPFVDVDDIAEIVAAALTEDGHVGKLYEVTGPRALTFRQALAEIAQASDRDIRYVPVTVDDYIAALKQQDDVPEIYVQLLELLTREVLDGRNAHLTDGVERVLGRKPRDFTDFARDAAATGIWKGQ